MNKYIDKYYSIVSPVRWLLIASVLTGLLACEQQEPSPSTNERLPVTALKIIAADVDIPYEFSGLAVGSREIEVRAQVGGILLKRNYVEGEMVRAGTVLFNIDATPFQAFFNQATASLQQQHSQFLRAKQSYNRILKLFANNAVSQKERDDAVADYESARAAVAVAEAVQEQARINLAYSHVRAPITGLTSKEYRSEGNLVSTTKEESLLTKIVQIDPIYVNFNVADNILFSMRKIQNTDRQAQPTDHQFQVRLLLGDDSFHSEYGYIDFTDTIINPQTGTVSMRAIVPNPQATLLPGQFLRVQLLGVKRRNVISVPKTAIVSSHYGSMVWVAVDNKAELKPIKLGTEVGQNVLVESGLKEGELLITNNLLKLRGNMPVKVQLNSSSTNQKLSVN